MNYYHEPVLLKESIKYLNINPNGIYVDGTVGGGGHSLKIAEKLSRKGKLIAIDKDEISINKSKNRLKNFPQVDFFLDNFSNLENILNSKQIKYIDGILLDLGISSFQIDDPKRGFSYKKNAILDMRMDTREKITAKEIINTYSEKQLNLIFKELGEVKYSKYISREIIKIRKIHLIETTFDLVNLIKSVLPEKEKRKKKHPGRKIFQSLRIETNKEIDELKKILIVGEKFLKKGGFFVIITFHSIEDRIVKIFFNKKENPCVCPRDFPICTCNKKATLKHITKKVCIPKEEEIYKNNRARSAKLRVAEKI